MINIIKGGLSGGRSSNVIQKWYVCSLKMLNSIEIEKKATKSMPPITFMDEDFRDIDRCHNDPMVVKIEASNFLVCKVLLDNGSSADVLYWSKFQQLGTLKSKIEPFPK